VPCASKAAARSKINEQLRLRCEYLYFCTSKVSTFALVKQAYLCQEEEGAHEAVGGALKRRGFEAVTSHETGEETKAAPTISVGSTTLVMLMVCRPEPLPASVFVLLTQ
jgi:hypothetical protein